MATEKPNPAPTPAPAPPPVPAPPPNPPPPAPKPKTPEIVKKTPLQSPRELALEKQVKSLQASHAVLEDKLDGLEGALKETQNWLEDKFPGGRAPTPTPGQAPATAPAPRRGVLASLHDELFRKD